MDGLLDVKGLLQWLNVRNGGYSIIRIESNDHFYTGVLSIDSNIAGF